MKPFQLEIISPDRTMFTGQVTSIVVPATDGRIGILANHAPMIASLEPGPMKVVGVDEATTIYALGGGFVEVADNLVRVVADVIERADEIDEERCRKAEERARARLKEGAPDMDLVRAEAALARALARIQALGALKGMRATGAERRRPGGG